MMESDKRLSIVNRLKADGKSILFISHRLDDIFKVADRVTTFVTVRLLQQKMQGGRAGQS